MNYRYIHFGKPRENFYGAVSEFIIIRSKIPHKNVQFCDSRVVCTISHDKSEDVKTT